MIWVHSGGTRPETGEPSPASSLRLGEALALLEGTHAGRARMLVSGGEGRKSAEGHQAGQLVDWFTGEFPELRDRVSACNGDVMGAFRMLAQEARAWPELRDETVLFVNDDVHMDRYLAQFAAEDPVFARGIVPVEVPLSSGLLGITYPRGYISCYNALAWHKLAAKGSVRKAVKALLAGSILGRVAQPELGLSRREWRQYPPIYRMHALPKDLNVLEAAKHNADLWTQDAVKRVGLAQLMLFAVDRGLSQPQQGLKAKMAGLAESLLREDLRGRG